MLNYRNVTMNLPMSQVMDLAAQDNVFAIEPAGQRRRFDEAQGQIVAGNLTGNDSSMLRNNRYSYRASKSGTIRPAS